MFPKETKKVSLARQMGSDFLKKIIDEIFSTYYDWYFKPT